MKNFFYAMIFSSILPFSACSTDDKNTSTPIPEGKEVGQEVAIFAGGCFWCVQHDFTDLEDQGLIKTDVGYSGGDLANPTYRNHGNHLEVMRIIFDPKKISYETLLNRFWPNVDATDAGGQFCDRGNSYRPAIFVTTPAQRKAAEASLKRAQKAIKDGKKITTPILDAKPYYLGEDYHQHYAKNNPVRYNYYRFSCGRDKRTADLWGNIENLK